MDSYSNALLWACAAFLIATGICLWSALQASSISRYGLSDSFIATPYRRTFLLLYIALLVIGVFAGVADQFAKIICVTVIFPVSTIIARLCFQCVILYAFSPDDDGRRRVRTKCIFVASLIAMAIFGLYWIYAF